MQDRPKEELNVVEHSNPEIEGSRAASTQSNSSLNTPTVSRAKVPTAKSSAKYHEVDMKYVIDKLATYGFEQRFQLPISEDEVAQLQREGVEPVVLAKNKWPQSLSFSSLSGRGTQELIFVKKMQTNDDNSMNTTMYDGMYFIKYGTISQNAQDENSLCAFLENPENHPQKSLSQRKSNTKYAYAMFLKYIQQDNAYIVECRTSVHADGAHPGLLIQKANLDGIQVNNAMETKALAALGEYQLKNNFYSKGNNKTGQYWRMMGAKKIDNERYLRGFYQDVCVNPNDMYELWSEEMEKREKEATAKEKANSGELVRKRSSNESKKNLLLKKTKSDDNIQIPSTVNKQVEPECKPTDLSVTEIVLPDATPITETSTSIFEQKITLYRSHKPLTPNQSNLENKALEESDEAMKLKN